MTENGKKAWYGVVFTVLPWLITAAVTIFGLAKASALGEAQQASTQAVERVAKTELCIKELQDICGQLKVSLGKIDTKLEGIDKRLGRIEDKP